MDDVSAYKKVKKPGIVAVIICKKRVLLVKRRAIPFLIDNPGIWTFVSGGTNHGELPIDTAYREVQEEVGLGRGHLRLADKQKVVMFDPRKRQTWENWFFVLVSDYDGVRKNYESSDIRWAKLNDILNKRDYTNIFANESRCIAAIKRHINE